MLDYGLNYAANQNPSDGPFQYAINGLFGFYTIALAVVGLIAIIMTIASSEMDNPMWLVFIFGFVAFQWVANYMLIKEDNR